MGETEIQRDIINALKVLGWEVYRMNAGRKGGLRLHPTGTPDLLAMRKGLAVWIEVKQPGKSPTDVQRERHEEIRANGFTVIVAHSVQEMIELLREAVNNHEG